MKKILFILLLFPIISYSQDCQGCVGDTLTIQQPLCSGGSGNFTIEIERPDNAIVSNPTFPYEDLSPITGDYYVRCIDASCGVTEDTLRVVVNTPLVVSCRYRDRQNGVSGAFNQWVNDCTVSVCSNGLNDITLQSTPNGPISSCFVVRPSGDTLNPSIGQAGGILLSNLDSSDSGIYTMFCVDQNGCTTEAVFDITIFDTPTCIANANDFCDGIDIDLTETGGDGVSWSWTGPNGFTSTLQNPTVTNTTSANAGTYTVVVTDANGCSSECTVDANYFTPVTITNVSCSF